MKFTATQLRRIIKEEVSRMFMETEESAQESGETSSLPGPVQDAINRMRLSSQDKEKLAQKVSRFVEDGKAIARWSEIEPQFERAENAQYPWISGAQEAFKAVMSTGQYEGWTPRDFEMVRTAMRHAEPSDKPIAF